MLVKNDRRASKINNVLIKYDAMSKLDKVVFHKILLQLKKLASIEGAPEQNVISALAELFEPQPTTNREKPMQVMLIKSPS
jgi:hypothetical protein